MTRRPPRLYKKDGWYYLVFYDPQTRRRKWVALGLRARDAAERAKGPMEKAWMAGSWSPFESAYAVTDTLQAALDRYDRERRDLKPESRRIVRVVVGLLAASLPAGIHTSQVTPTDCTRIVYRCASGAGQRTYRRTLSAFFSWAVAEGLCHTNPATAVRVAKKRPASPAFLSYDEAQRLLAACADPLHAAAVRFAIGSGLRLSEITRLRYADVRDGMIHVKQAKAGERRPPLSSWASDALAAGAPGPKPFPFRSDHLSKITKRAMAAADLSAHYHFHTLRHTFASWCRLRGVPIDRIQYWLGHSSITTTEVYAHLTPEAVAHEIGVVFDP